MVTNDVTLTIYTLLTHFFFLFLVSFHCLLSSYFHLLTLTFFLLLYSFCIILILTFYLLLSSSYLLILTFFSLLTLLPLFLLLFFAFFYFFFTSLCTLLPLFLLLYVLKRGYSHVIRLTCICKHHRRNMTHVPIQLPQIKLFNPVVSSSFLQMYWFTAKSTNSTYNATISSSMF